MSGYEDEHDKFLEFLDGSHEAVWLVARWLVTKGYNVKVNTGGRAEQRKDWQKYVDNGDLEIAQRVEVKALGCDFTCEDDWPFGRNFIVCAKHSFDNAIPKPFGYVYLNKAKTHLALLLSSTRDDWYVEERRDTRFKNQVQKFYIVDVSKVKFFALS